MQKRIKGNQIMAKPKVANCDQVTAKDEKVYTKAPREDAWEESFRLFKKKYMARIEPTLWPMIINFQPEMSPKIIIRKLNGFNAPEWKLAKRGYPAYMYGFQRGHWRVL